MNPVKVGAAVKAERLRRGLSIESVAAEAGVSHVTWTRVERGLSVKELSMAAVLRHIGVVEDALDTDDDGPRAVSDVVGARVAERRRALGLNREEFAARCGAEGVPMSLSVVTNIESGRRVQGAPRRAVTVDEMVVFAEVLGLHPLDLISADDDRRDPDQALLGRLVERSVAKGHMRVLRGFGVAS